MIIFSIGNKDWDIEYAIQLNESIKAISTIFSEMENASKESIGEHLILAKSELLKLQRKIICSNLNNYALAKTSSGEDNNESVLGLSKYLYLHQEVLRRRDNKLNYVYWHHMRLIILIIKRYPSV